MSVDSVSAEYTEAGSKQCDFEENDGKPENRMQSPKSTLMNLLCAQVLGLNLRYLRCLLTLTNY